tara:strand:+ start:1248 stop:1511 length:264 start_codon:yes stop_codon:yes gene_type:complete
MKESILALFILASLSGFSQDSEYKVSSYLTEGTKAPNTHYIGEAWLNAVVMQKCFVENKDGKIKDGAPEMTLFEFRDGKISRIFEYW